MFNKIKTIFSDFNKKLASLISFLEIKNFINLSGFKNFSFDKISEYSLKESKRLKQAGALTLCSCLLIITCVSVNSRMNAQATAGISSITSSASADSSVSSSGVVTTAAASTETYGYTNLGICNCDGNLNIRKKPSTDADILGKLPEHAGMEVIKTKGEWTKIKSGNCKGWVKSEYIVTGDEAKTLAKKYAENLATVTADCLYLREKRSTKSTILLRMPKGEKLEVLKDKGDWIKVSVDEEVGYCSSEYVTCAVELPEASTMEELTYGDGVSSTRVSLVNNATQYVGNPYVWGGTSLTHGADCSGFVLAIYAQYGISLPHSAASQSNYGTRISASEAQPGDLFFYSNGYRINHVAIYIGNGQIVHASNPTTGIKISNAYYRTPAKVVRLLNN